MKSAWIPNKPCYVVDQRGKRRKVLFIDNRGAYSNDRIGIDQYYDANHAVFNLISIADLATMPGYNEGTEAGNAAELYNKVFGI